MALIAVAVKRGLGFARGEGEHYTLLILGIGGYWWAVCANRFTNNMLKPYRPPVPTPQEKSDLSKKATETPARSVTEEKKNIENMELANLQVKDASVGKSQSMNIKKKLGIAFLARIIHERAREGFL